MDSEQLYLDWELKHQTNYNFALFRSIGALTFSDSDSDGGIASNRITVPLSFPVSFPLLSTPQKHTFHQNFSQQKNDAHVKVIPRLYFSCLYKQTRQASTILRVQDSDVIKAVLLESWTPTKKNKKKNNNVRTFRLCDSGPSNQQQFSTNKIER